MARKQPKQRCVDRERLLFALEKQVFPIVSYPLQDIAVHSSLRFTFLDLALTVRLRMILFFWLSLSLRHKQPGCIRFCRSSAALENKSCAWLSLL